MALTWHSWNMYDVRHKKGWVLWTTQTGKQCMIRKEHFGLALPNYPVPALAVEQSTWYVRSPVNKRMFELVYDHSSNIFLIFVC